MTDQEKIILQGFAHEMEKDAGWRDIVKVVKRGIRKGKASAYKTKKKTQSLISGGEGWQPGSKSMIGNVSNPGLSSKAAPVAKSAPSKTKARPIQDSIYAGNKSSENVSRGSNNIMAKVRGGGKKNTSKANNANKANKANNANKATKETIEDPKGASKTKQVLYGILGGGSVGAAGGYGLSQMNNN